VLRPLRRFQSPVDDGIQPMPYTMLQSARDERGSPPVDTTIGRPAGCAM
jgi:hypothetical protein